MNKFILVGANGKHGKKYFDLLSKRYNFVGLVDREEKSLHETYSDNSIPLFSNTDTAMRKVNFDAAIVCIPHNMQKATAISLLSAGKTVIKENPLAVSTNDIIDYSVIMSLNPDSKLCTIAQRQFNPVIIQAKNSLGLLGKIQSYKYEYNLIAPTEITEKKRGGVLIDMGYHALDMIFSFLKPAISTVASMSHCYDTTTIHALEDSVSVILEHDSGTMGTMMLNRHHYQECEIFEIVGSDATMKITPHSYEIFSRNGYLLQKRELLLDENTKQIMLSSYLNRMNDNTFARKNFEHHSSVVNAIEKIYENLKFEYRHAV